MLKEIEKILIILGLKIFIILATLARAFLWLVRIFLVILRFVLWIIPPIFNSIAKCLWLIFWIITLGKIVNKLSPKPTYGRNGMTTDDGEGF